MPPPSQGPSPTVGVQVVPELDLGAAKLERLQAAVADESPGLTVLHGPECPAVFGLVRDVELQRARDFGRCRVADPWRHERVGVHGNQRVQVVAAQRA